MHNAPLQNKTQSQRSEVATLSKQDTGTETRNEKGIEAGVPFFLRSSARSSASSPPPIQRQPSNEKEELLQDGVPLFLENSRLQGGPCLSDALLGLRDEVSHRSDLQQLLGAYGEGDALQGAKTLAARAGNGQQLSPDLQERAQQSTERNFSRVSIYDDVYAHLANAMLGTRAFALQGDIYLGPGHQAADPFVQREVLPHEMVHVVQQRAPLGDYQNRGQAEHEAHALAPNLRAGLPIYTQFTAGAGEQQGIIWFIAGGVAAIWFFSGESVANAPGYQRDRHGRFLRDERGNRRQQSTIASPSTGEYLSEASIATVLFVASGPVGGGARSLIGRLPVFSQGTGLASRLVPMAAQGYTSFSLFDAAFQTTQGSAPWEDEFSWQRNQTFGAVGGLTAPFLGGTAFYLLRAPAGAAPSTSQLVVYYGTSFTGSGLIGATAMQTMRPEFRGDEFLTDFALFGAGGALWARSMPNTLVVTDPKAFVMVDQVGEFGSAGTAYVVQETESGIFAVTRVGNFGSVVEAMPSGAAPRGLSVNGAADIIIDQAGSSFATLNNPMASGYGVPLGRQPLYIINETGDILLVEGVGVSPTTGYLGYGGAEGAAAFRTFFPSPSSQSISVWNNVTSELNNIYASASRSVCRAMTGRSGRTVSVTVSESGGTINVGISGMGSTQMENVLTQLRARFPNYNFAPVTSNLETLGFSQGFRNPPILPSGQTMARPQGTCAEPSVASQGQGQSMSTGWWSPTGRSVPLNYQVAPNEPWMLPCESCRANSDIMFPPQVCEMGNPASSTNASPSMIYILRNTTSSQEGN